MTYPVARLSCLLLALALPLSLYAQLEPLEQSAEAADAEMSPAEEAPATEPLAETVAESPAESSAATAETPPLDTIPVVVGEEPAAGPSARETSSNRLVEEIVVTAQKREERLQDVPISVQAFSQEKLDVLGLQSVQDIQRATPGFTVTTAAAFNVVFLRGVGSDAYLPGVDSSVPFYLDGVPLLNAQGSADTLGRIKRVEVLKGPQGTLFGRNATGGTISIVTPEPSQIFEGDVKLEVGNRDTRNITAFVNVPVFDNFAFTLAGFSNERDNILKNLSSGYLVPESFGRGGRVKARWDMTNTLALTLSGSYNETANNGGVAFQNVRPAPALAGGGLILPADETGLDRTVQLDGDAGAAGRGYLFSGALEWNLDWLNTKLTASTQKITPTFVGGPFDGTQRPIADAEGAQGDATQSVEQDTLELQFLSNNQTWGSDHFEWVAGVFMLESIGGFEPIVFSVAPDFFSSILPSFGVDNPAFQAAVGQFSDIINDTLALANLPPLASQESLQLANYGLIDAESIAFYAQGTWHAIDTVDVTAGVRYQDEDRELVGSRTSILLADESEVVLPLPQAELTKINAKQTSARLAFQWRPFGDDDQFYASWARAFKSPTFNTVNLTGNLFGTMVPLKAERVDTYELGVKTELLDGNVQLNAATFYTNQKDPLSANVSIPSGGIANFTNAQEAEIKGVDGDVLVIPFPSWNPGLVVTAGLSYLDAIYSEFTNGRGYDDATGLGFGNGGASLPPRDLSGKRIPRVPEWSYQWSINQRIDLANGNAIEIGADSFYTSKIYFLPQNSELSIREPTTLFNARVSYFHTAWDTEITAFINNLTDEIYADSAFVTDFGTALLVNEDPRIFGLRVKVLF